MFCGYNAIRAVLMIALASASGGVLSSQAPTEKALVAVLEPVTKSVKDITNIEKSAVTSAIEMCVNKSLRYRVVDRFRIDQIFAEGKFQRSGLVDPKLVQEIGKLLGAQFVCVPELMKEDGHTLINITLIDVETGVHEGSDSVLISATDPMAIRRKTEELAGSIFHVTSNQVIKEQRDAQAANRRAERELAVQKREQANREKAEKKEQARLAALEKKADKSTQKKKVLGIINRRSNAA